MVRRNAGRNLSKSVPMAKPVPDLGQFAYQWEKDLIADQKKRELFNNGFEQGVFTALAVAYRVLIYHYHELKHLKHRINTFEMYFNMFFETIAKPDEEQQFAEWYYEECTGYEFLRKANDSMASKQAKKDVGEFVNNYILKAEKTKLEVSKATGVPMSTLKNIRYGNVGKGAIDKVMKFLGVSFTPGEMAKYKEAYGVGNNNTARFKEIEEQLLAREEIKLDDVIETADIPKEIQEVLEEQLPQALAEADIKPVEPVVEESAPIPVPEELPELVEAVTANDDLPFSDVNEMYKEAEPEAPSFSATDLLKLKVVDGRNKLQQNVFEMDKLQKQIEELRKDNERINDGIRILEASIQAIEECGF